MPNRVLYRGDRKWIFTPRIWYGHVRKDPSLLVLSTVIGGACCLAVAAMIRHSLKNPDVHWQKKGERSTERFPPNKQFKLFNPSNRNYTGIEEFKPKLN